MVNIMSYVTILEEFITRIWTIRKGRNELNSKCFFVFVYYFAGQSACSQTYKEGFADRFNVDAFRTNYENKRTKNGIITY